MSSACSIAATSLPTPILFLRSAARRSEGFGFRLFYQLYKRLHRLLTGRTVEVGNFSVVPKELLDRLVGVCELWNHYAAAIIKARLPNVGVPVNRGQRIVGNPRMNFTSLVVHGLSAISVFGEEVGIRMLLATSVLTALCGVGLVAVLAIRFFTTLAIPGWATTAAGVLGVLMANGLLLSLMFIFIILQARSQQTFLPLRDYANYHLDVVETLQHD